MNIGEKQFTLKRQKKIFLSKKDVRKILPVEKNGILNKHEEQWIRLQNIIYKCIAIKND